MAAWTAVQARCRDALRQLLACPAAAAAAAAAPGATAPDGAAAAAAAARARRAGAGGEGAPQVAAAAAAWLAAFCRALKAELTPGGDLRTELQVGAGACRAGGAVLAALLEANSRLARIVQRLPQSNASLPCHVRSFGTQPCAGKPERRRRARTAVLQASNGALRRPVHWHCPRPSRPQGALGAAELELLCAAQHPPSLALLVLSRLAAGAPLTESQRVR